MLPASSLEARRLPKIQAKACENAEVLAKQNPPGGGGAPGRHHSARRVLPVPELAQGWGRDPKPGTAQHGLHKHPKGSRAGRAAGGWPGGGGTAKNLEACAVLRDSEPTPPASRRLCGDGDDERGRGSGWR